MKKALFVIAALAIISGLTNLHWPSPCGAWPPPPPESYYSPTVVDGLYGEWNINDPLTDPYSDFFANMYRAGNPTKPLEAKAYLRYDCVPNTLYVLVLTEPGVPALAAGWESAAWAAIGSVSNKVYTGLSGDNGIPPDFHWVNLSADGLTADGYEASFQLDPGTWSIIIHVEVFDSSASQTSATAGFPREGLPLTIVCEGEHPLAIHVNKYVSPDNMVTWYETTIPPGPTVVEGTPLYFKFVVTNSVNVTLTNITLIDTVYGNLGNPGNIPDISPPLPSSLGPDASYTGIIGPIIATGTGLHTNTATTTGNYGVTVVTESQDLYYTVIAAQTNPSIAVQKYVSADDLTYLDANVAPGLTVEAGAPVWFEFIVTNNGDVTLSNIQLTDSVYDLGGINPPLPSPFTLDPGALYTGVIGPIYEGVGQHTNTATANGEYNRGQYSDTDDANFLVISTPSGEPHLKLVKSSWLDMTVVAPDDRADVGDQINYSLVATNDGDVILTGVTVVDSKVSPLTPQWPGTPGTLLLGESVTFTGSYTLTQGDIDTGYVDNTATADSNQTSPIQTANTQDVPQNPHLTVTKVGTLDMTVVPPDDRADAGDKIDYTFAVTNTGNVTLTNINVTDPMFTVNGGPITLAPGASDTTTFTGSYTLKQSDIDAGKVDNTATASGKDPGNNDVTNTGSETVNITQHALIDVAKSSTTITITVAGQIVPYTFTVTNIGNVTLSAITVSDPSLDAPGAVYQSGDGNLDGKLDLTETWIYSGQHTVTQPEIDAGGYLSNTVTADSNESGRDTDSLDIPMSQEALINVAKSSTTTTITAAGQIVPYTFTVTNIGNVTLSAITVSDPSLDVPGAVYQSGDGNLDGKLDLTETWIYSGQHTVTQPEIDAGGYLSNTVTADSTESEPDTDSLDIPIIQQALIDVAKSSTTTTITAAGQIVPYTFTVTNIGNVTLSAITVSDPSLDAPGAVYQSGDDNLDGKLDLTETWIYSGQHTVTQPEIDTGGYLSNTVTADSTESEPDTDSLDIPIIQEALIDVAKSSTATTITTAGQIVTYTFTVTNIGNVTLSGITVSDPFLGAPALYVSGDANDDNKLDLTETWIYSGQHTVTQPEIDTGGYLSNTVTADSTESDPDSHTLDIPVTKNAAISVEKHGTLDMTVVAPITRADAGDQINYTFTVTNTGNVTLTNVTVTDPKVTVVGGPIVTLAPGASDSTTFSGSYTLTQADIDGGQVDNTATATGTPPSGPADGVTNTGSETTAITQSPGISVVKTGTLDTTVVAPTKLANAGDRINYSFVVTNTGNVTQSNVTVSDNPALTRGPIPASVASLAAGASTTFTGSYTLMQADIDAGKVDDIATATGTLPGDTVSGTDTETVTIPRPPATAVPGISLWGGVGLALVLAVLMIWILRRSSRTASAGPRN